MHRLPCTTTFRDASSVAYRAQFFFSFELMCLLVYCTGPAWWCFVWRERIPQGTRNISKKTHDWLTSCRSKHIGCWYLCLYFPFLPWQNAYKQAMQYSRSIPRQATSNTRSSVSATGRSPSPNSSNLLSFNENEVWMAEHGALVFSLLISIYVTASKYLIQFCCAVAGEVQDCSLPFCSMWAPWSTSWGYLFFVFLCLFFIFNLIILF